MICDAMQAGTNEKRDVVKVIVETTAYAKALVKLEEKSPDTNYWIGAGMFVVKDQRGAHLHPFIHQTHRKD